MSASQVGLRSLLDRMYPQDEEPSALDVVSDSSVDDEVARSGQMANESADQIQLNEQELEQALHTYMEAANPGWFSRVASGTAAGLMESPYAVNRQIGAAMAKTLGAGDEEIKKKISLERQLIELANAKLDRMRRKIEVDLMPARSEAENMKIMSEARAKDAAAAKDYSYAASMPSLTKQREARARFDESQAQAKIKDAESNKILREANARKAEADAQLSEARASLEPEKIRTDQKKAADLGRYYRELGAAALKNAEAARIRADAADRTASMYRGSTPANQEEKYQHEKAMKKAQQHAQSMVSYEKRLTANSERMQDLSRQMANNLKSDEMSSEEKESQNRILQAELESLAKINLNIQKDIEDEDKFYKDYMDRMMNPDTHDLKEMYPDDPSKLAPGHTFGVRDVGKKKATVVNKADREPRLIDMPASVNSPVGKMQLLEESLPQASMGDDVKKDPLGLFKGRK